ncbi:MAG: outer membrane protein assembly factor BamA [Proteobacteria bacterium]|nr:outer membrane protein assembly factor BamA [Pseudomonadota bacterium]
MKKLFISLLMLGSISVANAASLINKIELVGNKRIQDAVVLSYISYSEGMSYATGIEQKIVKDIFATGLFANITVSWDEQSGILKIEVEENAQINKVAFEGNKEVTDSVFKQEVGLKPRAIYSTLKVKRDVEKIEKIYQLKGYYKAKVFPEFIQRDQNRIDLIYKIEEGPRTLIGQINFIGNNKFSDDELASLISSRENRWWKFLTSGDTYDEERILFDAEKINMFYLNKGYIDFAIQEPVVELNENGNAFVVTFTMQEGRKYSFGSVDVNYDKTYIDMEPVEFTSIIDIQKNQTYRAKDVEKNIDKITDKLSKEGYVFTEVIPLIKKNIETKQVNLVFQIKLGRKVYIDRINIEGNTRTKDSVIRRQLRLSEGDALQANKLQRSKDRLKYTDYFSNVDIVPQETGEPDKVDLNVKVDEQSTGEFNVGAGVSSYEGFIATMNIKENNFLGGGQRLRLSFALSGKRKDYNIGITEPWFLNRDLTAGFDLFSNEKSYDSYDENATGGRVSLGFPIDEYRKNIVSLRAENKEILDIESDASQLIKDMMGENSKIAVSNTFSIDTRDSALMPTKGYNLAWTAEYAGFGGDINYIKNMVKSSYSYELKDDYVITVAGRTGYLWDINDDSPITENFKLGGNTLRGFEHAGVGPIDRLTEDKLGGKFMVGHNVELRYPIPGVTTPGINGLAFWDGGIVTSVNDAYDIVDDEKTYRQSIGAGIFWRSPIGPLRFELGLPIVSESSDDKEVFSFSFGTRF